MRTNFTTAVLLGLLLVSPVAAQEGVQWQANLDAARKLAAETDRLVLVHFWAPWCGPCMRLEKEVFTQELTRKGVDADFVAVKLNADHFPAKARQWGVNSLPTDVIITPAGQLVTKLEVNGSSTAEQYLARLSQVPGVKQAPEAVASKSMMAAAAASSSIPPAGSPSDSVASSPPPSWAVAAAAPADTAGTVSWPAMNAQAPQSWASSPPAAASNHAAPSSQEQAFQPKTDVAPQRSFTEQQQPQMPARPVWATEPTPSWSAQAQAEVPSPRVEPAPVQNRPAPPIANAPAPLAMDGYCPVTLVERQKWSEGDRRWGAIHRGRTYLFTSAEYQQRFLANPDSFSPVLSGHDPVIAISRGIAVPGKRAYGVFFNHRIYLFADENSLNLFGKAPHRYEAEVLQVEKPGATVRR